MDQLYEPLDAIGDARRRSAPRQGPPRSGQMGSTHTTATRTEDLAELVLAQRLPLDERGCKAVEGVPLPPQDLDGPVLRILDEPGHLSVHAGGDRLGVFASPAGVAPGDRIAVRSPELYRSDRLAHPPL